MFSLLVPEYMVTLSNRSIPLTILESIWSSSKDDGVVLVRVKLGYSSTPYATL